MVTIADDDGIHQICMMGCVAPPPVDRSHDNKGV